jgi:hypothetical protein
MALAHKCMASLEMSSRLLRSEKDHGEKETDATG